MKMSLINYYKNQLNNETWLSDIYQEFGILSIISSIINRRVAVKYSKSTYYPNLYLLFVGDSTSGKGTIINNVVESEVKSLINNMILPKRFTPEGLFSILSERGNMEETDEESRGIICNDELTSILSKKEYMSDLSNDLIELYNCPEIYTKRLAKKSYTLHDVFISALFGVQPLNLPEIINKSNITSGFLPRFILITHTPKKRHFTVNDKINSTYIKIISEELFDIFNNKIYYNKNDLQENSNLIENRITMGIDPVSINYIFAIMDNINKSTDPSISIYFNRILDNIIKLSMLYKIDELTHSIIPLYDDIKFINTTTNIIKDNNYYKDIDDIFDSITDNYLINEYKELSYAVNETINSIKTFNKTKQWNLNLFNNNINDIVKMNIITKSMVSVANTFLKLNIPNVEYIEINDSDVIEYNQSNLMIFTNVSNNIPTYTFDFNIHLQHVIRATYTILHEIYKKKVLLYSISGTDIGKLYMNILNAIIEKYKSKKYELYDNRICINTKDIQVSVNYKSTGQYHYVIDILTQEGIITDILSGIKPYPYHMKKFYVINETFLKYV
jgi:hypothetical protein